MRPNEHSTPNSPLSDPHEYYADFDTSNHLSPPDYASDPTHFASPPSYTVRSASTPGDTLARFTAAGRPFGITEATTCPRGINIVHSGSERSALHFTDDSRILVPIRIEDLQFEAAVPTGPLKKRQHISRVRRVLDPLRPGSGSGYKGHFKIVRMSRREYLRFWAKDEEGRYVGTEPWGEGLMRMFSGEGEVENVLERGPVRHTSFG